MPLGGQTVEQLGHLGRPLRRPAAGLEGHLAGDLPHGVGLVALAHQLVGVGVDDVEQS